MSVQILTGDCLALLPTLAPGSVQCCVTSPPYFGLRDYGADGQIGLESTLAEYVERIVAVFREVRRVLTDDGTLWLNLGDSYAGSYGAQGQRIGQGGITGKQIINHPKRASRTGQLRADGVKAKDLYGVPWRVAFALQADGWYLRQDIIWHKPNPMPESTTDRCTKAHEYLFLLAKSERYYFDADAIREPLAASSVARLAQNIAAQAGSSRANGGASEPMKAVQRRSGNLARKYRKDYGGAPDRGQRQAFAVPWEDAGRGRNKRSVWTVSTQPYSGAHFATMPPALVEPCILAGSRPNDTVLDPFSGAGTTGLVASRLGRAYVGIELNPEYVGISEKRIHDDAPLFSVDTANPTT